MADLTETVRQRIEALYRERRFRHNKVAADLGQTPSAVTKNVTEPGRSLSIRFIEAVAERAQVPVAELLVPPGSVIKQLSPLEARLLRYVRSWPTSVVQALVMFLEYWADEPPVEKQTRDLHELYRRMSEKNRLWLFSVGQLLQAGMLPPNVLEDLRAHLEADRLTRKDASGSRRKPQKTDDDA